MRQRVVFLVWMWGLLLPAAAWSQCILSFSGRVLDEDTRLPLAGASVLLVETQQQIISDSIGRFVLRGICPGNYTVRVSHTACAEQELHLHFQGDVQQDFSLPHTAAELADVTVIAKGSSKAGAIGQELKGRDLAATRGQTLGEMLQRVSGVSVLQTGANIYKPVIHGLHSNRILMLNNGIRQEGQQWGSEHAPEIDPFIANRITVIKGASTLRYGPDAIAGVVLVEPKLLRMQPGTSADLSGGFFSNNRLGFLSAMVERGSARHPAFAWRLQGTVRRGGNARTPNYWLDNSGLQEINFSATAGWRQRHRGLELFYSQFSTKLGIFSGSHIGNVTDLVNAINSGNPPDFIRNRPFSYEIRRPFQQVQHYLAKAKGYLQTGANSRLQNVLSYQYNWRREYDVRRTGNNTSIPQLDMSLHTVANDLAWDHYKGQKFRGTLGGNISYQQNSYSQRFFIPNYQAINAGLFAIEKYSHGSFTFEAGLRFDSRRIFQISRNNGQTKPDRYYGSTSGSLSVLYKANSWLTLNLNGSSAWRAPQVNELYSDGLHHGAARIERGNEMLAPERANSLMLSVQAQRKRWSAEVVLYHKQIADFIFLRPTFPPELTIRGAFPSFLFDQTDARINGLDASVQVELTEHLQWQGKLALVRAFDRRAKDWIIQMPADRMEQSIGYEFANKGAWRDPYVKLQWQWVQRQRRVPATGQIEITNPDGSKQFASDYAPPPPAYHLLGMEAGIARAKAGGQPVKLILSISNLLNTVYRDYMNAFRYFADEMGINVALRVQVSLGKT